MPQASKRRCSKRWARRSGVWVAMDYVDVVVHIFQTELRSFYKLEELWADAPMTKYEYEE